MTESTFVMPTAENPLYPTMQSLFDVAAPALLRQGAKSVNAKTGTCLYLGPNGLRCAIGLAIPAELHPEALNSKNAASLNSVWDYILWPHEMNPFACDLQRVHDRHPPRTWRELLLKLADNHRLSTACIDNLDVTTANGEPYL